MSHLPWSSAGMSTIISSPGANGTESGRLVGDGILSCMGNGSQKDPMMCRTKDRLASKSQTKIDEGDGGGDHLGDGLDGHRPVYMLATIRRLEIKLVHEQFGVGVSATSCHDVVDHS
eukprot:scaffold15799_cov41-Attheya_sp.AAC.2